MIVGKAVDNPVKSRAERKRETQMVVKISQKRRPRFELLADEGTLEGGRTEVEEALDMMKKEKREKVRIQKTTELVPFLYHHWAVQLNGAVYRRRIRQ